jgi:hypothetical protein
MFLTYEQLIELTGKTQKAAQRRVLDAMAIEYKVRPNGTLVVHEEHVTKIRKGLDTENPARLKVAPSPNWDEVKR